MRDAAGKCLQPLPDRTAVQVALLITTLGAVAMLFCSPTSWPHDDWDLSLVLMGRFGGDNVINFVNIGLSGVFRLLGTLSTTVNWFFWLRWLFSALSFGVILYAALVTLPLPVTLVADGLIKLVFWQVCFVECNFTRSAALFAAAGLALLTLFVRKKAGRWSLAAGLVLWAMGALWRPEAGLLAAPFALVILLYAWLLRVKKISDCIPSLKALLYKRRLIAALLGAAVITAGSWTVQSLFWNQPEWAEFEAFSNARSNFTDQASGGWEENQVILKTAGFTENDYWCMEHQTFADPEFFNLERMEVLGSLRLGAAPKTVGEFFKEKAFPFLIHLPFETRSFLAFCLIGGMVFLLGGWRQRLAVLAAGCGSLLISLGLLWKAYLPQRVLEAIFLAAIVSVLLLPVQHPLHRRFWLWGAAVVCTVCLCVTALRLIPRLQWPRVNTVSAGQTSDLAVNTAATDKEHVYLWDTYSTFTRVQQAYGLCALPDADFFTNNTILGGYHEYAPYMIETRRAMGAENPMRALVENPDALLVDDYMPENILLYVQQHYAPQAALSAAKDMGGGLWALALTTPLSAEEVQPLRWEMDKPEAAGGRKGWYAVTGHADGLEKADALWLKIENRAGESRCYRLVDKGGGTFGTGYYLDWTERDGNNLAYTLLWQQDGKIYESLDKK